MCGSWLNPGTRCPDRPPESASIRSHRGNCQNPRCDLGLPLRPARPGDCNHWQDHRPQPQRRGAGRPRARPVLAALGIPTNRGRRGGGGWAFRPARTRPGMRSAGVLFHFTGAADPGRSGSRGPRHDAHLYVRHVGRLDVPEGLPGDPSSRCSAMVSVGTGVPASKACRTSRSGRVPPDGKKTRSAGQPCPNR